MKSFAFRLERVLQWRTTSLKTEKAKLEPIRALLEDARIERETLAQALFQAKQAAYRNPLDGAALQALDSYAAWGDRQLTLLGGKILGHEQSVDKQNQVVVHCDRNVRLLERLRSRRKVEWLGEHDRELD